MQACYSKNGIGNFLGITLLKPLINFLKWMGMFIAFPLYSVLLNWFAHTCYRFSWFQTINQPLLRIWGRILAWPMQLNIHINEEDKKKFSEGSPKIILCNHTSLLDPVVFWCIMPKDVFLCFAAKTSLFKIPIFGTILAKNESVVINRKNPDEAFAKLRQAFQNTNKHTPNKSLVMYAEGTRNKTDKPLLPFKRGPFVIAKEFNLNILPVVLIGTKEALPKGSRLPKPTDIKIKALDMISKETLQTHDINDIKDHLWQSMKKELE